MVKVSVIGVGNMGAVHALNVAKHPEAQLHSVVDPDLGRAQQIASEYGVVATSDYREVMGSREVDAVVIASQSDTHAEIIKAAANAGKAIFCEKPIALTLEEVEECMELIKRSQTPFMLGFNRRFDPGFRRVHESLEAGGIGKVEMVSITSRDALPPPIDYVKVSGGIFRDMTIHDFDMARWLLGEEPSEVFATGSCLLGQGIEEVGDSDTAMVILKTPSGKLCQINNSRRSAVGYDQRLEVFGSDGCLQSEKMSPGGQEFDIPPMVQGNHFAHIFNRYAESYQAELDHFIQSLKSGTLPMIKAEDGLAALKIAYAAQKSRESGVPQLVSG